MTKDPSQMTDQDWQSQLTKDQYQVLREKGTEPPFTGQYVHTKDKGTYTCVACGQELFSSDTKFDSGSGWPSFYDVASQGKVKLVPDHSHGMNRTEVVCSRCGGHLGHLFDDGPKEQTGLHYCINSACLNLKPQSAHSDKKST